MDYKCALRDLNIGEIWNNNGIIACRTLSFICTKALTYIHHDTARIFIFHHIHEQYFVLSF